MHIASLTVTFALPGCAFLKEKLTQVGGLHQRFGKNPAVAVCSSDELDRHDASEWSFTIAMTDKREVESMCAQIEDKLQGVVDGRIMDIEKAFI